jgi:hypothetical protein
MMLLFLIKAPLCRIVKWETGIFALVKNTRIAGVL